MLDVIVATDRPLAPDDDTPARITFAPGGQAANVAAWVVALGGTATVFGPRGGHGPGLLASEALRARGIEAAGPAVERGGTVVSLVSGGRRSLASDSGGTEWLDQVSPGPWLDGADWLFVSGYALLRTRRPELIVTLAESARAAGTAVAVDLSSAAMITAYGAERFMRLWRSLTPRVVLANEEEWAVAGAEVDTTVVLKQGARGATFRTRERTEHRPPVPGRVVDATGAGDSLTAGFLLGGPDLAMHTAARCIARVGAQPPPDPAERP